MRTLLIKVSADDIAQAMTIDYTDPEEDRSLATHCPIARAVNRHFGDRTDARVHAGLVTYRDPQSGIRLAATLSQSAKDFVRDFDDKVFNRTPKAIYPKTFRLTFF